MKKRRFVMFALALMLVMAQLIAPPGRLASLGPTVVYANAQPIMVTVDGFFVRFTAAQPIQVDGRVMVPVRGVFERLGFDIGWDALVQTVTLSRPLSLLHSATHITVRIGDDFMTVNGQQVNLDVPAHIVDGSTMLPLRAVAEAAGAGVDWDPERRIARITPRPTADGVIAGFSGPLRMLGASSNARWVSSMSDVTFIRPDGTVANPLSIISFRTQLGPDQQPYPSERERRSILFSQINQSTTFRDLVQVAATDFNAGDFYGLLGLRADGTVVVVLDAIRLDGSILTAPHISSTLLPYHREIESAANPNALNMDVVRSRHEQRIAQLERMISEIEGWSDIIALSSDGRLVGTLGLRADGTIAHVSPLAESAPRETESWTDIIQLERAGFSIVGLRSDGTVVISDLIPPDNNMAHDVEDWNDIVAVSGSPTHLFGLRSNGTVVSSRGSSGWHLLAESTWSDIISISAIWGTLVGLRADGTVVMVSDQHFVRDGRAPAGNVDGFRDIVGILAHSSTVFGLRADGSVVMSHNAQDVFDVRVP